MSLTDYVFSRSVYIYYILTLDSSQPYQLYVECSSCELNKMKKIKSFLCCQLFEILRLNKKSCKTSNEKTDLLLYIFERELRDRLCPHSPPAPSQTSHKSLTMSGGQFCLLATFERRRLWVLEEICPSFFIWWRVGSWWGLTDVIASSPVEVLLAGASRHLWGEIGYSILSDCSDYK